MKTLRKSVDTAVLCFLYMLGSAFLAIMERAWSPVLRILGQPPRRVAEQENLTHVIHSAFRFIALSTVVGSWIVCHW
jgi:hypothetical protein